MEDNRTESWRAEAGRILRLAWPIMLTSLNWTLMHLIDVAVVGHYGTAELAALGASRTVTFIVLVMGFSGLTGILVFAARADGGGRQAQTGDIFRSGLALALLVGLVSALILGLFAFDLLSLFGVASTLQRPGAHVVQAMALGFPAQLLLGASSYFLEGISRPQRVMAINLTMLPFTGLLACAWLGGHFVLHGLRLGRGSARRQCGGRRGAGGGVAARHDRRRPLCAAARPDLASARLRRPDPGLALLR